MRAIDLVNEAMPFLERLRVLSGDSAPKDVRALKGVIRGEFAELVGELSLAGGPRASRVEQIFSLLLDQLAALQDGIEDEQNLTSFHILADYVASLFRSWNNLQQLFNTQTTIAEKQLHLLSDSVDEVRFAMEAASLELEKREIMAIRYLPRGMDQQQVTIEGMLMRIQTFANSGGPEAIQDFGGFALRNIIAPEASRLRRLVLATMDSRNVAAAPRNFASPPVQRTLRNLAGNLNELVWNC